MVILIFSLLFVLSPQTANAQQPKELAVDIIYDKGNPSQSVGILGRDIFKMGDRFKSYKIHDFQENAIVLRDQRNEDVIRYFTRKHTPPKIRKHARDEFVVDQLKAIYKAQMAYFNQYQKDHAKDLETLIRHDYLSDGFEDWVKQGYRFEIYKTGQTPRHALRHENMPTFLALASPVDQRKGDYYFSIDYLGQVRFGDTLRDSFKAPVWDYQEHGEGPRNRDIGLENDQFAYAF